MESDVFTAKLREICTCVFFVVVVVVVVVVIVVVVVVVVVVCCFCCCCCSYGSKMVSGYLSQCGKPNSKPPIFSGQYQLIPGFWRCPLHRAMWSAQHVTLAMRLALFRS